MKTIDNIPTSKLNRAAKILKTGVKVSGNYISYYSEKIINSDLDKSKLDENNAKDIYKGLSELKGSALKVAQMLSMEKNVIPQAYAKEFSQAQFSVPPLSPPLVEKTFRKYFGKATSQIFDAFDIKSTKAASMGQVHKAELDGEHLAVKIQYPGVAESISSDLALVKPFAIRMFNLKGKDSEKYFKEVEEKLKEETDYELELKRSQEITEACELIPGVRFPKYFNDLSSKKILTMSWLNGDQLSEFIEKNKDQDLANKIGQSLWDFYLYQMHELKKVHADPHPGNFLITDDNKLGVIDFGCIKEIPEVFYKPYFELTQVDALNNQKSFEEKMLLLEIVKESDKQEEYDFFLKVFHELLSLFARPFQQEEFDFSEADFFQEIADLGEKYGTSEEIKKFNGNRGSKHLLYMNRTFFGLYSLLYELKANIKINSYKKYLTNK